MIFPSDFYRFKTFLQSICYPNGEVYLRRFSVTFMKGCYSLKDVRYVEKLLPQYGFKRARIRVHDHEDGNIFMDANDFDPCPVYDNVFPAWRMRIEDMK